jgi:hypothetical protein
MADFAHNEAVERGNEAWNVAQGYTHLKILKGLVEMDDYVVMAIYGTLKIDNSFVTPEFIKVKLRIEAINRLVDKIFEVIENAEFAMTNKNTREHLQSLFKRTELVESVLNGIARTVIDQRTQESKIMINEDHFWACLNELRSIKKLLPHPLNANNLIFPSSDEIDLDKIKTDLIEGG